jgi:aryl-alcohol dehydrogenase-like predicted oxidoreductase
MLDQVAEVGVNFIDTADMYPQVQRWAPQRALPVAGLARSGVDLSLRQKMAVE